MRARCLSLDLEHNGPGYEWLDAGTQELQKKKKKIKKPNQQSYLKKTTERKKMTLTNK